MSERITEDLTINLLNQNLYKKQKFLIEKQISKNQSINDILKTASKSKTNKKGFPEFIIQPLDYPNYLIVIENKVNNAFHKSPDLNNPKDYAVDGAIHYGMKLSVKYNVISIGISGDKKTNLNISNYFIRKNSKKYVEITNPDGKPINKFIPFEDYLNHVVYDKNIRSQTFEDLLDFARTLHNFFREEAKLSDEQKPLIVCGTLIALQDIGFVKNFEYFNLKQLPTEWFAAITRQIKNAKIPKARKDQILTPYMTLRDHTPIVKKNKKFPNGILAEIIYQIKENVLPYITVFKRYDIIGKFFNEFLKYSGGDKQSFGIVLTPHHITDLFCDLSFLEKDSKVLDNCCGTGGFLVSAMYKMISKTNKQSEIDKIISSQLVGVEEKPDMFTLSAGNMILRGDGKTNLYQGDCFDDDILNEVKKHKCNIAMINPPFAQKQEENNELSYVLNILECLTKNGRCVAIVPMRCVTTPNQFKHEIMKNHTVEAVMSLPDDLFYPVGTVTCIVVIKAKVPHEESDIATWFGYWKDDGFIKDKRYGRADVHNRWPKIKERWVNSYKNKDVINTPDKEYISESLKRKITGDDEWCVEAYMETDYSKLNKELFNIHLKKLINYKLDKSDE